MKKYIITSNQLLIPKEDIIKINNNTVVSKHELNLSSSKTEIDLINYTKDILAQEIGRFLLENNLIEIKENNIETGKQINFEVNIIKP